MKAVYPSGMSNVMNLDVIMERISRLVCDVYRVSYDWLTATRTERGRAFRPPHLVEPRYVAMYLIREYTRASFPQIGRFFHVDHTTVIAGCRRMVAAFPPRAESLLERVLFMATTSQVGHA